MTRQQWEALQKIDFRDLQQEVCELWNDQGKKWCDLENVGFNYPDPPHYETFIMPWADEILDSPELCVQELGFDSIASYINSKRMEEHE